MKRRPIEAEMSKVSSTVLAGALSTVALLDYSQILFIVGKLKLFII
jgi:hypothetical protein